MKVSGPPNASHVFEGSGEIGDQIVGVLDADRVADQVVLDPDLQPLLGGELVEAHQRRLLDQALDAAERRRDLRNAAAVDDPGSGFEVAGNLERNDAAEAAHLAPARPRAAGESAGRHSAPR